MNRLKVVLRPLNENDIQDVLNIENNPQNWHLSGVTKPFTEKEIKEYIKNASAGIEQYGQIRFVIEVNHSFVGLIDLYEYNHTDAKAGVGIIIIELFRNKGIGKEALKKLLVYAKSIHLKNLFARIEKGNKSSESLFTSVGFNESKTLKNYIKKNNEFIDCKEYWIDL